MTDNYIKTAVEVSVDLFGIELEDLGDLDLVFCDVVFEEKERISDGRVIFEQSRLSDLLPTSLMVLDEMSTTFGNLNDVVRY